MYLSGHNTKLNPTSMTLLSIHPIRSLEEKHDKPMTTLSDLRVHKTYLIYSTVILTLSAANMASLSLNSGKT